MNHNQIQLSINVDVGIAPIVKHVLELYECYLVPFSSCENNEGLAYIMMVARQPDKVNDLIHTIFVKLVDKIEVEWNSNDVTIRWPAKETSKVIKAIEFDELRRKLL